MFLTAMTEPECEALLTSGSFAHLACIDGDRPYVVPIHYVFQTGGFYSFSMPGKKIDSLRKNPHACVQLETIGTDGGWQSVVLDGLYQELPDTPEWHDEHMNAWSLLQKRTNWWEPGAYTVDAGAPDTPVLPVFYSLRINSLSGRKATH